MLPSPKEILHMTEGWLMRTQSIVLVLETIGSYTVKIVEISAQELSYTSMHMVISAAGAVCRDLFTGSLSLPGRFVAPAREEELFKLEAILKQFFLLLQEISHGNFTPGASDISEGTLYRAKLADLICTINRRMYDTRKWLYDQGSLTFDADHRIRSAYAFMIMLQDHNIYEQINAEHIDNTISILETYDSLFMEKSVSSDRAQSALLQIVGDRELTLICWVDDRATANLIERIREIRLSGPYAQVPHKEIHN